MIWNNDVQTIFARIERRLQVKTVNPPFTSHKQYLKPSSAHSCQIPRRSTIGVPQGGPWDPWFPKLWSTLSGLVMGLEKAAVLTEGPKPMRPK